MVVFVDGSGDGGFSADGPHVGDVLDGLRLHVRWPLPPGLVGPVAVVMRQVLAEQKGQVSFAKDQGPVKQLAAQGPDDAFADSVGPHRQRHPIQMTGTDVSG